MSVGRGRDPSLLLRMTFRGIRRIPPAKDTGTGSTTCRDDKMELKAGHLPV